MSTPAHQCSTSNNIARANSGYRLPISQRPWGHVQRLMREHGISQRDVEALSGVPLTTVNRALSIRFAHRTYFGAVVLVRRAVEQLLRDVGVDVCGGDLWTDYDINLKLTS